MLRFLTSSYSEGLSSVARVIVIIIIYFHSKRLCASVPVCPGIFIADFPSICAPIVFTHPHGIFHFEISCVKWCISLRTHLLRTNHKDSKAIRWNTRFDRSHWIWNAHYDDGSNANLLFHISFVLSIRCDRGRGVMEIFTDFKSFVMCTNITGIAVCKNLHVFEWVWVCVPLSTSVFPCICVCACLFMDFVSSTYICHSMLFNCHRNSKAISFVRIECKYIYLFMKRFSIS